MAERSYLNRNVRLLAFSAFFADMGYQAVTAVFAIFLVIELKEPAYYYGILLGLSFGIGSLFSLLGGKLGDRYGRKSMALLGNLLIPLMSIGVLFNNVILIGLFFMFGWWARYFRTPVRRAWMVEISDPEYRSNIFGYLHALDIGGGLIAVGYSVAFVIAGVQLRDIILFTAVPILVSSLCLAFADTEKHEKYLAANGNPELSEDKGETAETNGFVFRAILFSATLFGFSYYALGFPVITVSGASHSYTYGILTFGIYLGVSAIAGLLLGSLRGKKPLTTLWSLGYLLAAASSFAIGLSFITHTGLWLYYIGAAGLGFATGSVETFEPVLISAVSKSGKLSAGMGWLSSTRSVGLFVSNIVMGALFVLSEFYSYAYASIASLAAAVILMAAQVRMQRRKGKLQD